MSDVADKTSGFIDNLGRAAQRNPLSAALIGMGILWLVAGKSTGRVTDLLQSTGLDRIPDTVRDTFSSVQSDLGDRTAAARNAARSSFNAVRDKSGDAVNQAAEFAGGIPNSDALGTARDNLAALFKAQPLALGAIGLAIGAGIAAALPATEVESAYLGEASETVRSKSAEIAGQQVDKAKTLATQVIDAATEEASKQGLTTEGVEAAAADLASKVGRVVEAARTGGAEQITPTDLKLNRQQ
jgi:hypothetical protein